MPALDNADMVAILGDDYLAKKEELSSPLFMYQ